MSDESPDLLDLLASQNVPEGHTDGAQQAIDNADDWWRSTALLAIREMARSGQEFTADDIRELGVTEPDQPNRWGGAFLTIAREGLIEAVGARRSTRGPRNGSLVRVWRGVAA